MICHGPVSVAFSIRKSMERLLIYSKIFSEDRLGSEAGGTYFIRISFLADCTLAGVTSCLQIPNFYVEARDPSSSIEVCLIFVEWRTSNDLPLSLCPCITRRALKIGLDVPASLISKPN